MAIKTKKRPAKGVPPSPLNLEAVAESILHTYGLHSNFRTGNVEPVYIAEIVDNRIAVLESPSGTVSRIPLTEASFAYTKGGSSLEAMLDEHLHVLLHKLPEGLLKKVLVRKGLAPDPSVAVAPAQGSSSGGWLQSPYVGFAVFDRAGPSLKAYWCATFNDGGKTRKMFPFIANTRFVPGGTGKVSVYMVLQDCSSSEEYQAPQENVHTFESAAAEAVFPEKALNSVKKFFEDYANEGGTLWLV